MYSSSSAEDLFSDVVLLLIAEIPVWVCTNASRSCFTLLDLFLLIIFGVASGDISPFMGRESPVLIAVPDNCSESSFLESPVRDTAFLESSYAWLYAGVINLTTYLVYF